LNVAATGGVQGAALDFVQKGRMEGNACELYICCILLSRGYAFCLVATVQFIKLGSNTDQRTELFVTSNNNMDDNTAVNKVSVCTVKMGSPNETI
jgi:hypothetical protein